MDTTLTTRKPVDHMTLEDLAMFPVWEYALDEESFPERDETWVRPVATKVVPADSWQQLVVAGFTSRAWTGPMNGFVIVTTAKEATLSDTGHFDTCGGSIIRASGGYHFIPVNPIPFPTSSVPKIKLLREMFAAFLGSGVSDIFPIHYRLSVLIEGESAYRQGTLD